MGQRWRGRVNTRCRTSLSALANTRGSADICTESSEKRRERGRDGRGGGVREGAEKRGSSFTEFTLHRLQRGTAAASVWKGNFL